MNKEIITDKQVIALLAFVMVGDKLIFAIASQAKKDLWLDNSLLFSFYKMNANYLKVGIKISK